MALSLPVRRNSRTVKLLFACVVFMTTVGVKLNIPTAVPNPLPVEKAFVVSAGLQDSRLSIRWDMPEGYYLYRESIDISGTAEVLVTDVAIPRGLSKSDEFFGDVEVFYKQLDVSSTVTTSLEKFHVLVTYQGCAEVGLCYPRQKCWIELESEPSVGFWQRFVEFIGLADNDGEAPKPTFQQRSCVEPPVDASLQ